MLKSNIQSKINNTIWPILKEELDKQVWDKVALQLRDGIAGRPDRRRMVGRLQVQLADHLRWDEWERRSRRNRRSLS